MNKSTHDATRSFHGTMESSIIKGAELKYSICPAEKMTRDYPGCPAYVEDLEVHLGGIDIYKFLDSVTVQKLENEIMEGE